MNCSNTKWVFPPTNPQGIEVPCGKCVACLSNKRTDWAFRLEQEYKSSKSAAFITLTYASKYVPDYGVDKTHFQKFMKRLRKKSGDRLRYYAVGEYGTQTNRPHYHAIIFNFQGNEKFLQQIWPFGIVHIGKVNQASIMYTTKYVIQKDDAPKGQTKPFALMSRRYGLGLSYLTDAMALWHRSSLRSHSNIMGRLGRLPRYYKEKLWPNTTWKSAQNDWSQLRLQVSQKAKQAASEQAEKNLEIIRSFGFNDPIAAQTEMRNAVMQRVKQKVAFTQTI